MLPMTGVLARIASRIATVLRISTCRVSRPSTKAPTRNSSTASPGKYMPGGSTSSNTGFNCSSTVRASHTRNWIDTTIGTSNNNPRKVCAVNQLHIRLTAIALSPPNKLFPQKTASDACSAGPCHQKDEGEDTWNWRAIHAPATASRDLYFPREMIEDA